jgi:hypothetical protein
MEDCPDKMDKPKDGVNDENGQSAIEYAHEMQFGPSELP